MSFVWKRFSVRLLRISACILFSGQLPTGRSVEPEVQVKQQQTTINGNAQLLKSQFFAEKKHFVYANYNFL